MKMNLMSALGGEKSVDLSVAPQTDYLLFSSQLFTSCLKLTHRPNSERTAHRNPLDHNIERDRELLNAAYRQILKQATPLSKVWTAESDASMQNDQMVEHTTCVTSPAQVLPLFARTILY